MPELFISRQATFWGLGFNYDHMIVAEAASHLGIFNPEEMYDFWQMMMGL